MKVLFIFLDGIGLGANDPNVNPLARAAMPNLAALLGGRKLLAESAPYNGDLATLLALDTILGVEGVPQSGSNQAVLMTGRNIPQEIGEHYGPKPNAPIRAILNEDNLFKRLTAKGKRCALLNAYPPRYFHGVESGRRLLSSIPHAVTSAGIPLFTDADLYAGRALSADFTGEGWRSMLGYPDAPLYDPHEAGEKMIELARQYDFSLFEYWASDYAGHEQNMEQAIKLMEIFDLVLGGIFAQMSKLHNDELLVLITSDHGNMEDLSTRRHTTVPVPGLVIGAHRNPFTVGLKDLSGIAGKIEAEILK
jgi:hypothetical protein